MVAPSSLASAKSAAGVLLDENMMSDPVMPSERAIISSVSLEQSAPHPYSRKMEISRGLGLAFTAKYSLNPGFHAKASRMASIFLRMPASSYRWKGVG